MTSPLQSFSFKSKDCFICYESLINPLKYGIRTHNKCINKWSLLYHNHTLCHNFKLKKSNIKNTEKQFIKKILSKLLPH
jgi:hypothetical protein